MYICVSNVYITIECYICVYVCFNVFLSHIASYMLLTVSNCLHYIVPTLHVVVTHPTATGAAAPFSALFSCSIQAYGYLTITWYRNNEDSVPSKANFMVIPSINATTSILTIPNVTSEDVGTYYCLAWANNTAVRSHTANLFLAGKVHLNI